MFAAERNRGLSLRLHGTLMIGWLVGALKTLAQAVCIYSREQNQGKGSLFKLIVVFLAQTINIVMQMQLVRVLKSTRREEQIFQERRKRLCSNISDLGMIICLFHLDYIDSYTPRPLNAMMVSSALAALDMIRLRILLQLFVFKWIGFCLLEITSTRSNFLKTTSDLGSLIVSLLILVFFSLMSAAIEADRRKTFLDDCRKPASLLPSLWQRLTMVLCRMGLMPTDNNNVREGLWLHDHAD